jgi:hypothetical protein
MSNQEVQTNQKIEDLLVQLSDSRNALSLYMVDVDSLRKKVDGIFPTNTADFRNKFVLEEKIKAASSFYSTLLNIRQEYNKTIKEEIEIRRKIINKEDDESSIDVRAIANMVEDHQKKNKEMGVDIIKP